MLIIGCDYHPSVQQIAFVDTETGDYGEHRLKGSVAKWQGISGSVKGHDRRSASVVSRATLCRRGDYSVRPLVPEIFTELSRSDRNDAGTASFCGSIYDLEVGATVCTRTECADAA